MRILIISDMSVDLTQAVDARVASVFRPTDIYFPPYSREEVSEILKERVQQGAVPQHPLRRDAHARHRPDDAER